MKFVKLGLSGIAICAAQWLASAQTTYPCPAAGGTTLIPNGITTDPVTIRIPIISNPYGLCTLVRQNYNSDATPMGAERAPIARSYAGRKWEVSAGRFANTGSGLHIECASEATTCDLTLPALSEGQQYILQSFEHPLGAEAEAARFLEQATFGTTRGDMQSLVASDLDFSSWLQTQMYDLPASSLRQFYRKRVNPKTEYSYKVGTVGPRPCEQHSRWRKYALSSRDFLSNRKTKIYKILTVEQIEGIPGYVWKVDGLFRTVTQDLPVLLDFYSGQPDGQPEFALGWKYRLKNDGAATWEVNCVGCILPIYASKGSGALIEPYFYGVANPPVSIAGVEGVDDIDIDVFNLPLFGTKDLPIVDNPDDYPLFEKWMGYDEHAMLNTTDLEESGVCDGFPNYRLPIPRYDNGPGLPADLRGPPQIFPTVFGRSVHAATGEEQVFAYDPHLVLYQNTVENPLPDGGGKLVMDTDGLVGNTNYDGTYAGSQVLCQNTPRSFLNEDNCKLSYLKTACAPDTLPNSVIVLNEDNLSGINSLSVTKLYAITGLPLSPTLDTSTGKNAPCADMNRITQISRWIKDDNDLDCANSASLQPQTLKLFRDILDARDNSYHAFNWNPDVVDAKRNWRNCDPADVSKTNLGKVKASDGSCWVHVHPSERTIYDLTALAGLDNYVTGGGMVSIPVNIFDTEIDKNEAVYPRMGHQNSVEARFGDHFLLDGTETAPLNDPEIQVLYKSLDYNPAEEAVLICGSPDEVASNPYYGDRGFDVVLPEGTGHRSTSIWTLSAQRHTTWTHLALHAKDQLRMKMAWSLSQIVSVGLPGNGMVFMEVTEPYLIFYDIFVKHAFGNYRDIMKEFSFSVLMGGWLSFIDNASLHYNLFLSKDKVVNYPDENFAREIMQLFTIGLHQLNVDGSNILLDNGKKAETYDISDIMSYSRAWTGFTAPPVRGGTVGGGRQWADARMDPMYINDQLRDVFPKSDISNGYIGDRVALCADLPKKHFLRKGATYKLLASSVKTELQNDNGRYNWEKNPELLRLEIKDSSPLWTRLCAPNNDGVCTFPSKVVLEENLHYDAIAQDGAEYAVDTIRSIKLKDGLSNTIHYEYVRQPCVEHAFYDDAKKVIKGNIKWGVQAETMCANPRTEVATPMCSLAGWENSGALGYIYCHYQGERVTYSSAERICEENGLVQSHPMNVKEHTSGPCGNGISFHYFRSWADAGCGLKVKVAFESGHIAIVHNPAPDRAGQKIVEPLVDKDTMNFFKALWTEGVYPNPSDCNDSPSCEMHSNGESCICDAIINENAVYASAAEISSIDELMVSLHIGAADPTAFDEGMYIFIGNCGIQGVSVYSSNGDCSSFSSSTIFAFQWNSKLFFLKNSKSMVSIAEGSFRFRNPVHHISLSDPESRDMYYETESVLDSLFYHPSHPPFLAIRLIQRFGHSNPSPGFIERVATAYKIGAHKEFGSGKYGDLGAMVAAILLDDEMRQVALDSDQSHGHLREPLIKLLSFFRSMDLSFESPLHIPTLIDLNGKIGQGSFEYPSVFSFFLPEFTPMGVVQSAGLYSPEAMVLQGNLVRNLLDGMFSTIKFGIHNCKNIGGANFAGWGQKYPLECTTEEGNTLLSNAHITYYPTSTATSDDIIDELAILLTSGRLGDENREIIKSYVDEAYHSGDIDKAVRIAQQLIFASPEYHATNIARKQHVPREISGYTTEPAEPYKAVVILMMLGGADSFNLLVPKGQCKTTTPDGYTEYKNARGNHALPESLLTSIHDYGSNQDCSEFGVNSDFQFLADLYNDDEAIFVANMGPLSKPMNKTNDWVKESKFQLFAHNTMQHIFYTGDPYEKNPGTGVFGRILDVLKLQGFQTSANSVGGIGELMLTGDQLYNNPVFSVSSDPPKAMNQFPTIGHAFEVVKELNGIGDISNSFLSETWFSRVASALFEQEQMETTASLPHFQIDDYPVDSGEPLTSRLKAVATYMKSREFRKVNREVFIVPHTSYDLHPANTLSELIIPANAAVKGFVKELKKQELWDSTALIMGSDFGRTLSANANGGTDHAWGGNYFLAGGNVKGGKILGNYPQPLSPDHPNWLERGRFIPTTPWDAVWNGVAQWLGVHDDTDLDWALPNRNSFDKCTLFSDEDLFRDGACSCEGCKDVSPAPTPVSPPITSKPTNTPTKAPTLDPTPVPTSAPTKSPSENSTSLPTSTPTSNSNPTNTPTTKAPTSNPTPIPTSAPTKAPSQNPSSLPTSTQTSNCESNLLQDGDMETIDGAWRAWGSDIYLTTGVTGDAIAAENRTTWRSGIRQDLGVNDFACLTIGTIMHIDFKVRLFNKNGVGISCDPTNDTSTGCPLITFRQSFDTDHISLWNYIRSPEMQWDPNGWNDFHGVYEVDMDWATHGGKDNHWWYIMISGGPIGSVIVADDVTMTVEHTLTPTPLPTNYYGQTPSPTTASPSVTPSSVSAEADSVAAKTYNLDAGVDDLEFMGNNTSKYNASSNVLTLLLERGDYYENMTAMMMLWVLNPSIAMNETVCGPGQESAENVKVLGSLTTVLYGATSTLLSQDVALNLTGIDDSNIFSNTSDAAGEIKFCARVDYMDSGYSVGFTETLVNLAVNMTAGFAISEVDVTRNDPTSQEAKADFVIDCCICDDSNKCDENPLISQNSPFRVCLTAPADGLKIATVQDLDMIQDGETKFSPVNDGTENSLTTVETYDSANMVVATRAISMFFTETNPSNINIVGSVLLEFESGARRVIKDSNVFDTETKTGGDDTPSGVFELSVALQPVTDLDITTDENDKEEKKDNVVVEGQEKEDSVATSGESVGNTVPINLIVGVAGAVVCTLILAVGFRRLRGRSDSAVAAKYDGMLKYNEVGSSV